MKRHRQSSIWQSLEDQAAEISHSALRVVNSLSDWERELPDRRREFAVSLGLDPLPPRCDLEIRRTGELSGTGFRVEKLGYQILPGCRGSGAIFYPDPLPETPLPAVLYTCGHGKLGLWMCQAHGILWARRGYICLIINSLEQEDNMGEHHIFATRQQDRWLALGVCPAGAETYNSMRALDILAANPFVDAQRIGITGVSGGGAQSFFTTVLDPRIRAVSTLCGLCTTKDAVGNRHLTRHCDCMFVLNSFQRDLSDFAALIAPRPLQFCFGDQDSLFHEAETTALAERTRRIFRLFGKEESCRLIRADCPHGDHPDFDRATQDWFDFHVAGKSHPLLERGEREFSEQELSVFNGVPPRRSRYVFLPELLAERGGIPLPETPEAWPAIRRAAIGALPPLAPPPSAVGEAGFQVSGEWNLGEKGIGQTHCGTVAGVGLRMETTLPPNWNGQLVLSVAGRGENELDARARAGDALPDDPIAVAALAPRLSGTHFPAPCQPPRLGGSATTPADILLLRAMMILGQTPVMLLIEDLRAAISHLRNLPIFADAKITLLAGEEAAVAALYVALTDEKIASAVLANMPSSHADGAPIPGILRTLDIPQAVGLLAPRRVALLHPAHNYWSWTSRAYERTHSLPNYIVAPSVSKALQHALG